MLKILEGFLTIQEFQKIGELEKQLQKHIWSIIVPVFFLGLMAEMNESEDLVCQEPILSDSKKREEHTGLSLGR